MVLSHYISAWQIFVNEKLAWMWSIFWEVLVLFLQYISGYHHKLLIWWIGLWPLLVYTPDFFIALREYFHESLLPFLVNELVHCLRKKDEKCTPVWYYVKTLEKTLWPQIEWLGRAEVWVGGREKRNVIFL